MRVWSRLLLAGLCALASGGLFRLYVSGGTPLLRMLATIGLVLTGWLLASALERWQVGLALTELERRLASQPGVRCLALPPAAARRQRWEAAYLAIGPGGAMLVAAVGISNATWGRLARRLLAAHAAALRRRVRELKGLLPASGSSGPVGGGPRVGAASGSRSVPVYGMLVLLRRRILREERDQLRLQGVGVAHPDHFPKVLGPVVQPAVPGLDPLPASWQQALQDAVRPVWRLRELAVVPVPQAAMGAPVATPKG